MISNGPAKEATDVEADRSEEEAHSCPPLPLTPNMGECREEAKRKK